MNVCEFQSPAQNIGSAGGFRGIRGFESKKRHIFVNSRRILKFSTTMDSWEKQKTARYRENQSCQIISVIHCHWKFQDPTQIDEDMAFFDPKSRIPQQFFKMMQNCSLEIQINSWILKNFYRK